MSTSMYWQPAPPPRPEHSLPYELKKAISQRYWNHDGSLYGEKIEINQGDRAYFEGLADGGTPEVREGAREILEAIRVHGVVEIWIGA